MILFVTHFRYSYDISDKINTWAYPVLRYTKTSTHPASSAGIILCRSYCKADKVLYVLGDTHCKDEHKQVHILGVCKYDFIIPDFNPECHALFQRPTLPLCSG